jgi:hypothetical protein
MTYREAKTRSGHRREPAVLHAGDGRASRNGKPESGARYLWQLRSNAHRAVRNVAILVTRYR